MVNTLEKIMHNWEEYAFPSAGGIQLHPDSPIDINYIWAGYEDDYANISTYDATTAYLVVEWNNPGGWWQPGTDTMGYYPLNSTDTYYDQSWNSRDLSTNYGSVSYWTYHGVDCAYINVWELRTSAFTAINTTTITESVWYYQDAAPNNDNATIMWARNWTQGQSIWPIMANWWPDSKYGLCAYWDDASSTSCSSATTLTSGWHHIVQTYDGTTMTLYVDWVSVVTQSYSIFSWGISYLQLSRDSDLDRSIKGCLSEAIFESKCWSSAEVLAYFNNTKSNYGIS